MFTINRLILIFLLSPWFALSLSANTQNAATCNLSDVQTAINAAAKGDTVQIPTGSCTWTSGVTISGINIKGAGAGRIIAYDNGTELLTIGTGTLTMTIAGYSPGFSSSSISNGETLQIFEKNNRSNYMQGTVTSLSGSTLTMNITSTGGSGGTHRWLVATLPSTVLIFNAGSNVLFNVNESTTNTTSISGIQFSVGTNSACCSTYYIQNNYTAGGKPILIHDNYFQNGTGHLEAIQSNTNQGVIWNNSFEGSSYTNSTMVTVGGYRTKIDSPQTGQNTWVQQSYWGTLDTTGTHAVYVETNDFHTLQAAADLDDNSRTVWRYNLMDEATVSTHGNDTSPYGIRYVEYYNNRGIHNAYSDGTTFNLPNGWLGIIRGGTFVFHDNNLDLDGGTSDYGTQADAKTAEFFLREKTGYNTSDRCWGAGGAAGQYYPAPRQLGFGRVTGTGAVNYPANSMNNASTDNTTYVGDSEPAYLWNNTRTATVSTSDYAPNECTNPDSAANYFVSGRDYFIGTAKPGYTAFTYPHPLTLGQTTGSSLEPPTSLAATVQ